MCFANYNEKRRKGSAPNGHVEETTSLMVLHVVSVHIATDWEPTAVRAADRQDR